MTSVMSSIIEGHWRRTRRYGEEFPNLTSINDTDSKELRMYHRNTKYVQAHCTLCYILESEWRKRPRASHVRVGCGDCWPVRTAAVAGISSILSGSIMFAIGFICHHLFMFPFYISCWSLGFTWRFILFSFNIFYMLLHISLLLYLFHNIQLEWHCIA